MAMAHLMDTFGRDTPFLPSDASLRLFRLLWQLEVWLREMVYVELRSRDVDWQEPIKKVVQNWPPRSQAPDKRPTHMATHHESVISYLPLGELLRVIQDQSNWPLFESYFPPKDNFGPRTMEISQIRHRIAHFRDPHQWDLDRVRLFLKDLDQGFWRFATSYSGGDGIWLTGNMSDPVSEYFIETHHRRWLVEMLAIDGNWQYAGDGRRPRLNFHIQGSSRPWCSLAGSSLAGQSGFIYHAKFSSLSENRFSVDRILEQTESVHSHCIHVRLETHSVEVMVPSVLGRDIVVATIERFLERCIESVSPGTPFDIQRVEQIASEWPEYVLGPTSPLGFLNSDMHCPMFVLD